MRNFSVLALSVALSVALSAQTKVGTVPIYQTYVLQSSVNQVASATGTSIYGINGRDLIVTLDVTAADSGGTYDFYITTSDGVSSWDIAHFTQIAGTSAKRYTAIISGSVYPVNITTAGPGVLAVTTGTLETETAGSNNGIKTLGAGLVRHGPWGSRIGYSLVAAGTITTGVTYSITLTVK